MPMNIFPTNATNGQQVTAGGTVFTYVAATDEWIGSVGGAVPTTGIITGTAAQDYQKSACSVHHQVALCDVLLVTICCSIGVSN
jgi:hypothetical protein